MLGGAIEFIVSKPSGIWKIYIVFVGEGASFVISIVPKHIVAKFRVQEDIWMILSTLLHCKLALIFHRSSVQYDVSMPFFIILRLLVISFSCRYCLIVLRLLSIRIMIKLYRHCLKGLTVTPLKLYGKALRKLLFMKNFRVVSIRLIVSQLWKTRNFEEFRTTCF